MDLVFYIIGTAVGSIVTLLVIFFRSVAGTLRIDHSDPEKDVYRIDIQDLDKLSKRKNVILTIDNHADLSLK